MIKSKNSYADYGDNYPNSRKIYVTGSDSSIRVPMREIKLSDTKKTDDTVNENEPIIVYDTSGPSTDPNINIDLNKGLPKLRQKWIEERSDTEIYESRGYQPGDDGLRQDQNRIPFSDEKMVLRAKDNSNVSQMHYAKKGINGVMLTISRKKSKSYQWEIKHTKLENVANIEKELPKSFISRDGFGITRSCKKYIENLISGQDYPPYKDGIPQYAKLKHILLKKRLKNFKANL